MFRGGFRWLTDPCCVRTIFSASAVRDPRAGRVRVVLDSDRERVFAALPPRVNTPDLLCWAFKGSGRLQSAIGFLVSTRKR